MNYLVLLKSYTEAKTWMQFKKDSREVELMVSGNACCVISTEFGMSDVQSANNFQRPMEEGWVVVAYLRGEETNGNKQGQQRMLKENIDKTVYRIFHHGGGLNFGETTTKGVKDKFKNAGFKDAGFLDSKLICFSGTRKGNFPWDADIDKVRKIFKGENMGNCSDALEHMKLAWDKAWPYFNIDQPIEKVIKGLFPLYVDATNLTSSTDQADWNAALSSAWSNFNRRLDELGFPDGTQLLTNWKEIVAQVDNKAKPLIYAAISLLNHSIIVFEVTEEVRGGVPDGEREKFIAMFKFLSDTYYSKHPEFSAPPK